MSNSIEIETKALLSKSDYELLIDAYKGYPSYVQVNHYIDTPDRKLKAIAIALRVREKNGKLEMTLKVPLEQGLLEVNHIIGEEEFIGFKEFNNLPDCEIKERLESLGISISDLKILASLKTTRVDVPYKGGTLSIDKNEYSGITDFEVELEGNKICKTLNDLKELLQSYNIPFVENKEHKIARAMNSRNDWALQNAR